MKRLDFEEITTAVRWGGKLGLLLFAPASVLLVIATIIGDFGLGDTDVLSRWVRLGLESFLMGGWALGAVSIVRQYVARLLGAAMGVFSGGMTGVLVMNLMAVTFEFIAPDAPPILAVLVIGAVVSFSAAGVMARNGKR